MVSSRPTKHSSLLTQQMYIFYILYEQTSSWAQTREKSLRWGNSGGLLLPNHPLAPALFTIKLDVQCTCYATRYNKSPILWNVWYNGTWKLIAKTEGRLMRFQLIFVFHCISKENLLNRLVVGAMTSAYIYIWWANWYSAQGNESDLLHPAVFF